LHPFGEPFRAAFIVTKRAVRGISDPAYLILADVAKFRDFFSGEEEPRVIPSELKKLFLIELHRGLISW